MTTIEDVRGDEVAFTDDGGRPHGTMRSWAPTKVTKERIDAEIERLAQGPTPPGGRRVALLVHPESTGPGLGLAPGIQVAIEVLLPGECTTPVRQNAGSVQIGIHGRGVVAVAGRDHALDVWDVATVPAMKPHEFRNDNTERWVRLSYSNAPLLAKLGVHYVEELESSLPAPRPAPAEPVASAATRGTAPDLSIGSEGARLRGYEHIVDSEVVTNAPLHWPWAEVSRHLSSEVGDGKRPILAYYNPATERRCGATHNFFVTAMVVPPGKPSASVDRGHRHTSVAINYHFRGTGYSVVAGQRIDWKAGDLLLSAPGWAEHAHYWGPEGLAAFTVQDHPQQIAMESLVWQEEMDGPVIALGSEAGQTGYIGPREAG
jgi:gentisate 1,2-dioxygenase